MDAIIDKENKIFSYPQKDTDFDFMNRNVTRIVNEIFPEYELLFGREIFLSELSLKHFFNHTENLSVRYKPDVISIPDYKPVDIITLPAQNLFITKTIPRVTIKPLGLITDEEAYLFREQTPDELRANLRRECEPKYGKIKDSEIISLWYLR